MPNWKPVRTVENSFHNNEYKIEATIQKLGHHRSPPPPGLSWGSCCLIFN
jgi:hypothetical protein